MNDLKIIGRLGADPKEFQTKHGRAYSFSIAHDIYTRNNPSRTLVKSKTNWYMVKAFGKSADLAHALRKGELIEMSGSIQTEEYKDKEGVLKRQIVLYMKDYTYISEKAPESQIPKHSEVVQKAPESQVMQHSEVVQKAPESQVMQHSEAVQKAPEPQAMQHSEVVQKAPESKAPKHNKAARKAQGKETAGLEMEME